ncbi:class I adenylate-forming enzyme family protein [Rhodococcus opacus]|jgi:fatty-acyl-CoA synthase/long-chain acyl-CoA synthetase|uniref:class I adenylate-forming enzyme family protein n=1 Tax=Rhodococcus opacus TaxID=37919 RepID=UPI0016014E9B|nr:AMP-binding protein [Rhodococcus opacus]QZS52753.1 AMP-binding protein [Rhodococcus opacus]
MRDAFDHSLTLNADSVAIEFGSRRTTYAELDRWADAVAVQLAGYGIGPGDPVAIYLHNCPAFFAVDVAIARLGAVKVPLNYMLPTGTVGHCLAKAKARVLVTGTRLAEAARSAASELPDLILVEACEDEHASPSGNRVLVGEPASENRPARLPELGEHVTPESPAALYFTGGTTGLPKGVLHSQASTLAFHYAQLLEAEILQDERLLLMTPLAHAAGLFGQSALIRGATIVLTDGFDAEGTAQLLTESHITWVFLVPTMIYRLIDILQGSERQLDLRTIVYGAAPIAPSRLEQALALFGQVFVQLYGQTESPNWGTRLGKKDHDVTRPHLLGSCGQASIMADVKIVDDTGQTLGPTETGEICLRTPYLLDRYVDAPEATDEKFLDGWIRTGDIGMLDQAGYLYLLDRKSDMVISGGMNVYCREVEDMLTTHPSIKDVAVIGIPHPDWGEAVHAVVVTAGNDFDADAVIQWTRGRLAAYARPKSIEVVESLPETPFGKVDKKVLRAPHWSEQARAIG